MIMYNPLDLLLKTFHVNYSTNFIKSKIMFKKLMLVSLFLSLLATHCTPPNTAQEAPEAEETTGPSEPFETANVRFETNATDGDVEVVFEVKGGDEGLLNLKIVGPDGRTVVDFTAPDASTMGIRQFRMESPEPTDIPALKKAYPEGAYKLSATDTEGTRFQGEATLNHTLPASVSFLTPEEEAEDVEIEGLQITWTPVAGMAAYIVEIEQDDLEVSIIATLSGDATSFAIPANFLAPGLEYTFAIGSVAENGNMSFVETTFTTAGEGEEE